MISHDLRRKIKNHLGPYWTAWLRCLVRRKGLPLWGNLRRIKPFSTSFGSDRGTPVDRYYLHKFLEQNRAYITGDVLEIQMPGYTYQYGHNIRRAHSIDIHPQVQPTFVCDLAHSESILPSESYDCFLLPNTLCVLYDIEGCLRHALRVIKPGGVILASTASFVPLAPDYPDYWRLTAAGWMEIAQRVWPNCDVLVESYGNCLAAVAAMLGLALEELTPAELDVFDPHYPVLITIFCRKLSVRAPL
jgi:hypothetical protein